MPGLREALNKSPRITSTVAAGVVGAVVALVVWRGCSTERRAAQLQVGNAYYTTDDGKTYFPDVVTRLPPYTHDGKTAYRVRVVQCGTGKPYVSHLEKYSDAQRQQLEQRLKDPKVGAVMSNFMHSFNEPGVLVKKPLTGDKGWIALTPETEKQYNAIVRAVCPDGTPARPVYPQ